MRIGERWDRMNHAVSAEVMMTDILYIGLTIAFFALSWGLVRLAGKL